MAVKPVSSQPFPSDLKSLLPNPRTPWNVSSLLFNRIQAQPADQPFRLCEVLNTDPEFNFILKYFESQKSAGYSIKRIVCIHNPDHTQVFEGTLKNQDRESNNPVFAPKGKEEEPRSDRARVITRWEAQVSQFSPVEIKSANSRQTDLCYKAKVLPLWHGSSELVCKSVCSSGFTSFGKHHFFDENATKGGNKSTDKGYFGSGIYFTNSAQYATMYSSEGHLLLSWVSMREPYPVVNDKPHPQKGSDMIKLGGKQHYQNYNAHYIPVASIRPQDPKCLEYYPCYKDHPPAWDEFVVFYPSQTLPRFWIELGLDFPTVTVDTASNVRELLTLILSLLDKEEIQKHNVLPGVLKAKVERLLESPETTPLEAQDQKFFKEAKMLMSGGEKISPSAINILLSSVDPGSAPVIPSLKNPPTKAIAALDLLIASLSTDISTSSAKSTLIAFGKEKWAEYIGDVGEEPPLPFDIDKILKSPCPFFPGKKVEETHLLTLIPKTVNGKPLTLTSLEELVKHPKKNSATRYLVYWDEIKKAYGNAAPLSSYWVLLTKDVIPTSRNQSYDAQKQLLASYSQKTQVLYEIPHLLEVSVSVLMEYLRTGKTLYSYNPPTFTRCQERVSIYSKDWLLIVGGFTAGSGLMVRNDFGDNEYGGVGGLRRL
jgi:hypothetical protein